MTSLCRVPGVFVGSQVFRLGSRNHLSEPSFRVSLDITKKHAAKHFHDSAFLKEAALGFAL